MTAATGWDLAAWGEAAVRGPAHGGARNEIVRVELDGRRCIARRGRRGGEALGWEVELLCHLAASGVGVPKLVPAQDGRLFVGSTIVMEEVRGDRLAKADRVAIPRALRRVHAATTGWAQRPGFLSSRELLVADRGGDIDLAAMPADAARSCREAWARLPDLPHTVVHGDPNPGNAIESSGGVVLLDWDEARVDHPWLDLAALGRELSELPPSDADVAYRAAVAWDAAMCWHDEPDYARHRLAEIG